ncbi:SID1 transmembrane family member 1 [Eurytemora carolleeae]|uniref:SID1 transmembrane family member 1 n=1 Tax=Eurytemora carolleeae TaxID=1294199 RepID=UPI000C788417|nr:SID1 transmembrane family member 1 [Eurytemora carolleeae]|eukprot:XP_023328500.1 SID1 transmembrane family member 1-like [Eurytemora affinis]
MGICLILQGLFSAIFHICPSNISLQFDTTMMNMMMILVFIKIFQLRHADTAYNAFHVMYVFAVVLVFEAVSLYVFNTAWRLVLYVLFVFCYVLLMVHMGVDIYYYGAVKTSIRKMVPVMVKHALRYKEECLNTKKFILTSVFFLINTFLLSFIVYRASQDPGRSLSTPLLFIGGANVGMYLVYYFVNKLQEICYDEELEQDSTTPTKFMRGLSFIFFLTALVIGVIAGVFYYMKHQSRNSTPPESRNKNELCNLMNFYDNHDLWHFFSGTALFFALVGLLIIDDDLLFIDRGRIRVF